MVNYSENDRWTFHAYSDRLFPRSFGWNSSFFIALPRLILTVRIAKKSNLKTPLNSREQIIKIIQTCQIIWSFYGQSDGKFRSSNHMGHGSILWGLEFIPFPSVQQCCKFNLMCVIFRFHESSGSNISNKCPLFPPKWWWVAARTRLGFFAQNNHPQPWSPRHHVMNPTYRS